MTVERGTEASRQTIRASFALPARKRLITPEDEADEIENAYARGYNAALDDIQGGTATNETQHGGQGMFAYQHLKAGQDINGNPQRLFVVYEINDAEVGIHKIIDEGYAGRPVEVRGMPELPSMNISVDEYNDWLKAGELLDAR